MHDEFNQKEGRAGVNVDVERAVRANGVRGGRQRLPGDPPLSNRWLDAPYGRVAFLVFGAASAAHGLQPFGAATPVGSADSSIAAHHPSSRGIHRHIAVWRP